MSDHLVSDRLRFKVFLLDEAQDRRLTKSLSRIKGAYGTPWSDDGAAFHIDRGVPAIVETDYFRIREIAGNVEELDKFLSGLAKLAELAMDAHYTTLMRSEGRYSAPRTASPPRASHQASAGHPASDAPAEPPAEQAQPSSDGSPRP